MTGSQIGNSNLNLENPLKWFSSLTCFPLPVTENVDKLPLWDLVYWLRSRIYLRNHTSDLSNISLWERSCYLVSNWYACASWGGWISCFRWSVLLSDFLYFRSYNDSQLLICQISTSILLKIDCILGKFFIFFRFDICYNLFIAYQSLIAILMCYST